MTSATCTVGGVGLLPFCSLLHPEIKKTIKLKAIATRTPAWRNFAFLFFMDIKNSSMSLSQTEKM
jgi:hypothetical protein